MHFDEGLLHAAFPAAIPLNDGCFKRDTLEAGHMERDVSGGGGKIPVIVAAAKKRTLTCPCRQKRVLLCERVTKRSRIEVKVSKSSVTALFDKLEFVDYIGVPTSIKLPSKS